MKNKAGFQTLIVLIILMGVSLGAGYLVGQQLVNVVILSERAWMTIAGVALSAGVGIIGWAIVTRRNKEGSS